MIDSPAFIVLVVVGGTRLTGRAVSYSDPLHADAYSTFCWKDAEGVTNYVLWSAIVHLVVFPLEEASK